MKFVILTGMSGAGKSTAIKMMEDMGFYCVDNIPIALLEKFVELTDLQSNELQKVAVGIDIRSGQALGELRDVLDRIQKRGVSDPVSGCRRLWSGKTIQRNQKKSSAFRGRTG